MVPPPTKRRSPHPASCAQVGRSRFPMGRGAGPGTSRSRIVPSRLHAVVLPVQRLQPEFTPSTRVSGSGADPGAFAGDPLRPMESERHALARRPRGPTRSAPQSRCYGLRRVRRNAAGKARWGKHFGVHRTVRSPFNRVDALRPINTKSRLQGLRSEPQALLRRPNLGAMCAECRTGTSGTRLPSSGDHVSKKDRFAQEPGVPEVMGQSSGPLSVPVGAGGGGRNRVPRPRCNPFEVRTV